jgi:hypothetical protein
VLLHFALPAIVFLSLVPDNPTKMEILFLCRTQGQKLEDFMFREGSNVAIHILDNIAYEAGGLALRELHQAARTLLRDKLWESLSHNHLPLPDSKGFGQMLPLVDVDTILPQAPLGFSRTTKTANLTVSGELQGEIADLFNGNAPIEWQPVILAMREEKIFSPNFVAESLEEIGHELTVFYMPLVDLFLVVGVDAQSSLLQVKIAARRRNLEKMRLATETFVNFVLRFVWNTL